MPTLTADVFPVQGRVLVTADWSDVPAAICARVERVIDATGARAPLRGYVYPCPTPGEYQHLSGGVAIFWDTEAPLEVAFHYETDAVDVLGVQIMAVGDPVLYDTGSRTVANGWGTPDIGPVWTHPVGAAADYSVGGGLLTESVGAVPADRSGLVDLNMTNGQILATTDCPVPTGAGEIGFAIRMRQGGTAFFTVDTLQVNVRHFVGSTVQMELLEIAGFVFIGTTALAPIPGVALGDPITVRAEANGFTFRAKAWLAGTPEPDAWLQTLTLGKPAKGGVVQFIASIGAGITNPTPFVVTWDNINVTSYDPTDVAMTASTGPLTMDSLDGFWLRDPVRPCNDRRLDICFNPADPACVAGTGIAFAAMETESYDANTAVMMPTNRRRPIPVARTRRDAGSQITLITRTFADRDDLNETLEPGGPLLFQAPPEYGIPDRYMSVAAVSVARGITDHRYPVRVDTLPFVTVDRPVGPTQGTCDSQFGTLCSEYATWTVAATGGRPWSELITGSPASLGYETWGEINTDYADWNAVLAVGTWTDVLESP